jgi:hypothetical protein
MERRLREELVFHISIEPTIRAEQTCKQATKRHHRRIRSSSPEES